MANNPQNRGGEFAIFPFLGMTGLQRKNDVAWPSIDHYPTWLCNQVDQFLKSAHLAASTIATKWREHKGAPSRNCAPSSPPSPPHHFPTRHTTRRQAVAALTGGYATVKLDGTNVGKDSDGIMYGRRWTIPAGTESYQKTPLHDVYAADVGAVREAVCAALTAAPVATATAGEMEREAAALAACRFVVYGELMCNAGLYDYAATGLAGAWLAFGVVAQFSDEGAARAFAVSAARAGFEASFRPREEDDDCGGAAAAPGTAAWKVLLCGNPRLRSIFRGAGLKVPEAVCDEGASLVERGAAFMVAERGEGVVVTLPGAGKDGGPILRKWKIGKEVQLSSRHAMLKTKVALEADAAATVLLESSASAVPLMWDILERTGGGERAERAPKAKKKGGTAARAPAITDPGPVADALASALTKYDSLESYFVAAGSGAAVVALLAGELGDEICTDLGYVAGSKEAARVRSGLKHFVGSQFGAWKSTQRQHK